MFRGSTGFRKPVTGGSGDFSQIDFGVDFSTATYAVFDDTAFLFGTDDNDSSNQFNYRIIIAPSGFANVVGSKSVQLEFRFGTICATVANGIASVYFGQAGASVPNFAGDQVQVTFGGASAINASASGIVLSDTITLAQTFDVTKNYMCSFFVNASGVSLSTTPNDSSVTLWTDKGAVGANQAALTVPTTASYSSIASKLSFLAKVIL